MNHFDVSLLLLPLSSSLSICSCTFIDILPVQPQPLCALAVPLLREPERMLRGFVLPETTPLSNTL